jgi:hypothetical protein
MWPNFIINVKLSAAMISSPISNEQGVGNPMIGDIKSDYEENNLIIFISYEI